MLGRGSLCFEGGREGRPRPFSEVVGYVSCREDNSLRYLIIIAHISMLIHGIFLLLDTLRSWPWHSWKCHRAFRGTRSRAKKLDPNLGDLNLRCKNCHVFSVAFGHQWKGKNWDKTKLHWIQ